MQADRIERALVIGGGTMGNGIAQVLAQAGVTTTLADIDAGVLERAMANITRNLTKGVEKGKVTAEDRDAALGRLSTATDATAASDGVQCVVEAVPEKMELKRAILAPRRCSDAGAASGRRVNLSTKPRKKPAPRQKARSALNGT